MTNPYRCILKSSETSNKASGGCLPAREYHPNRTNSLLLFIVYSLYYTLIIPRISHIIFIFFYNLHLYCLSHICYSMLYVHIPLLFFIRRLGIYIPLLLINFNWVKLNLVLLLLLFKLYHVYHNYEPPLSQRQRGFFPKLKYLLYIIITINVDQKKKRYLLKHQCELSCKAVVQTYTCILYTKSFFLRF